MIILEADPISLDTLHDSSDSDIGPALKLGQRVATQIEKDVIAEGWPVGKMLGSEPELIRRYGVSRSVLREAISIVERDGLAYMRRGRGGGLVIAAPAQETVVSALRTYLEFSGVEYHEIEETRECLETLALSLAARRMDDSHVEAMRALLSENFDATKKGSLAVAYRILQEITRAANNPALQMFISALSRLSVSLSIYRGVTEKDIIREAPQFLKIRRAQIKAIIAADMTTAYEKEKAQIDQSRKIIKRASSKKTSTLSLTNIKAKEELVNRLLDTEQSSRRIKQSDLVAIQLQTSIQYGGWKEGTHIGSESKLLSKYKVSRGALREAIRSLERFNVVEMERGKKGGLKVGSPKPDATIKSTILYLKFLKLDQSDIFDIAEVLELRATELAARRVKREGKEGVAALRAIIQQADLAGEINFTRYLRKLYLAIAKSSGNRAITLFLRILAELITFETPAKRKNTQAKVKALHKVLENLIKAIEEGDEAMARRRMIQVRQAGMPLRPKPRDVEDLLVQL